jgi:hypothetical protein
MRKLAARWNILMDKLLGMPMWYKCRCGMVWDAYRGDSYDSDMKHADCPDCEDSTGTARIWFKSQFPKQFLE